MLSAATVPAVAHFRWPFGGRVNTRLNIQQQSCRPKVLPVHSQSTSLSVHQSRMWLWIDHLQLVYILLQLLHLQWLGSGLCCASVCCGVWEGGQTMSCSLHLHPVPQFLAFQIGKFPSHMRSLHQSLIYSVLVGMPLPPHWDILWLSLIGNTNPLFFMFTVCPSPLVATGYWW